VSDFGHVIVHRGLGNVQRLPRGLAKNKPPYMPIETPNFVQRENLRAAAGPDLRRPEISPPYRYRHAVMMRFPLSSQAVLSIRLLLAK
jgi:hypothetical protein